MKSKVSSLYISLPHDHLHRTPDPLEKRINVAEILSKLGGIRSVGSDQGRGHTSQSYGLASGWLPRQRNRDAAA